MDAVLRGMVFSSSLQTGESYEFSESDYLTNRDKQFLGVLVDCTREGRIDQNGLKAELSRQRIPCARSTILQRANRLVDMGFLEKTIFKDPARRQCNHRPSVEFVLRSPSQAKVIQISAAMTRLNKADNMPRTKRKLLSEIEQSNNTLLRELLLFSETPLKDLLFGMMPRCLRFTNREQHEAILNHFQHNTEQLVVHTTSDAEGMLANVQDLRILVALILEMRGSHTARIDLMSLCRRIGIVTNNTSKRRVFTAIQRLRSTKFTYIFQSPSSPLAEFIEESLGSHSLNFIQEIGSFTDIDSADTPRGLKVKLHPALVSEEILSHCELIASTITEMSNLSPLLINHHNRSRARNTDHYCTLQDWKKSVAPGADNYKFRDQLARIFQKRGYENFCFDEGEAEIVLGNLNIKYTRIAESEAIQVTVVDR